MIPTPELQITAWAALVAGISYLITFAVVVRSDLQKKQISANYRVVCFLLLVAFMILSLIVNIGVVLSDVG